MRTRRRAATSSHGQVVLSYSSYAQYQPPVFACECGGTQLASRSRVIYYTCCWRPRRYGRLRTIHAGLRRGYLPSIGQQSRNRSQQMLEAGRPCARHDLNVVLDGASPASKRVSEGSACVRWLTAETNGAHALPLASRRPARTPFAVVPLLCSSRARRE